MKYVIILTALVLSGCATNHVPQSSLSDPRVVWCAVSEPIRMTEAEINSSTEETLNRNLSHNLRGEVWCGWNAQ